MKVRQRNSTCTNEDFNGLGLKESSMRSAKKPAKTNTNRQNQNGLGRPIVAGKSRWKGSFYFETHKFLL